VNQTRKTNADLVQDLSACHRQIAEMERHHARHVQTQKLLEKTIHALGERNKELTCLYGIAHVVEKNDALRDILQGIANLVPPGWQYPELTCARIVHENCTVETPNFRETEWKQTSVIKVRGAVIGAVEVYYTEPMVPMDEGPFLEEERHLIDAIAERVGKITEQKMAEEELRRLAANLVTVQEAERKHISREIHDELGQLLTGLRMEVYLLNSHLSGEYPDDQASRSIVAKADGIIDTIHRAIKHIISSLRPNILDDRGLFEAVKVLVDEFGKRTGIKCESEIAIDEGELDATQTIALYRIIQESLTNISRHAKATRVVIRCQDQDETLVLEVDDDGTGFSTGSEQFVEGWGLMGMRERARLMGGAFSIKSAPLAGTRIQVRIPVARAPIRLKTP
jgi:two-component system NarL family sensor kinase